MAFAAGLGSGHLDSGGGDAGRLLPGAAGQRAAVSYAEGHRIISLGSLVPGQVHGRVDLTASAQLERAVRGGGASLVDLDGPGAPLCHTVHARDPHAGEQVYLIDVASGADVLDELSGADG